MFPYQIYLGGNRWSMYVVDGDMSSLHRLGI